MLVAAAGIMEKVESVFQLSTFPITLFFSIHPLDVNNLLRHYA